MGFRVFESHNYEHPSQPARKLTSIQSLSFLDENMYTLKRILAIFVAHHKSTNETDETRKDENRPRRKHENNAICSLSVCLANDIIERKPLTFLTSPLDRNVSPFHCFPNLDNNYIGCLRAKDKFSHFIL